MDKLQSIVESASQVFLLTDENVASEWLPDIKDVLHCKNAIEIIIKAGEKYKNLQTIQSIWTIFMKHHADRNALLINFGGGVITDLGGFAASTYKRGIRFVNYPSTLLAMVDAAIGGKTGVNFGGVKNQIGTFAVAEHVEINNTLLLSLPHREILSGLAEMLKYGFISDPELLQADTENYWHYIMRASEIKYEIVEKDFREAGLRKILNFGHTLGHAIESQSLITITPLLHGEAVALGMEAALWLSVKQCGLKKMVLQDYEKMQLPMLLSEAEIKISESDVEIILDDLAHDKKNKGDKQQFVLIEDVGKPVWDVEVPETLVCKALDYTLSKVQKP